MPNSCDSRPAGVRSVLAIDPGTTVSAAVRITNGKIEPLGVMPNDQILDLVRNGVGADCIACEWIESFGMAVGKEVFETVYLVGRLAEAARVPFHRVTRREVKLNLCRTMKAKDPNIRQALLDRYGGSSAIGRKAAPGPLYGISSHQWAALAVGVTFLDAPAAPPGATEVTDEHSPTRTLPTRIIAS